MAYSQNRRCHTPRSCLRKRLFEIRSSFSIALKKADFICRQRKLAHHHSAVKSTLYADVLVKIVMLTTISPSTRTFIFYG